MSDVTPPSSPPVWRRDEVDSPCVQICMIHPGAKICIGCYRTADEISQWSRLSAEERTAIRAELPGRADMLRDASVRPSRRRRGARASQRSNET